ncbi:DEKNAAC101382 [Brettanomyces naardenensis]|uniref:DEKNAAC101383 n=1 Tax=Brettanomyces naardenensis TaxID=13370 RepID=A0A448YHR2_BRENA|nr:DEKNAAC101382 [Brettanomyces naardenensis]
MRHTFEWPHSDAQEVYVSGSFDNWTGKFRLEQNNPTSSFKLSIEVPYQKFYYKFIVDGDWVTSASDKQENDPSGIWNNVVYPDEISNDDDGVSEYTAISYPTSGEETGLQQKTSSICNNIVQINEEDLSSSVQITIKDDNSVITKNDNGASTPRSLRSKAPTPLQASSSASSRGFLSKLRTLFTT